MKPSLRELFLAPEALDPSSNPLVRLGALHHLHRIVERDQVRGKLERLLSEESARPSSDIASNLFPLHVAVVLAQEGGFDGIQWLVHYLGACDQRHERLGFTALRNCRQFPLAVLLSCTTTARSIATCHGLLGALSGFSDDHAWSLVTKSNPAECAATMSALEFALQQVQGTLRTDRKLSVGTVISRPLRKPLTGLRYTGFLVVEEDPRRWRAVPYQMADVINRDDGSAPVTGSDLLRNAGRRALVAYDLGECNEAQALYALPFAPLQDMSTILPEIALRCEGISVGVIVHKWTSRTGEMYRLVTSSGQTEARPDRSGKLRVGECAFIHSSSSGPFFTRLQIARPDIERVLAKFIRATTLERSVLLRSWKSGYRLGGQSGRIVDFRDDVPEEPVVLLEDLMIKEVPHTFPVRLPYSVWTAEDRSAVLSQFLANSSGYYAVVIAVLAASKDGNRILLVNSASGSTHVRWAGAEIRASTPALWEVGTDDRLHITLLQDQVVLADCSACLDTGHRLCESCNGENRINCPECGGSGKEACGHCDGRGAQYWNCPRCDGTGYCNNCQGSQKITLTCKVCEGLGYYSNTGRPCVKCHGNPKFEVPCNSCNKGPQSRGLCPKCRGAKSFSKPCATCRATPGWWDCHRCHGRKTTSCDTCDGSLASACRCGGSNRVRLRPLNGGG